MSEEFEDSNISRSFFFSLLRNLGYFVPGEYMLKDSPVIYEQVCGWRRISQGSVNTGKAQHSNPPSIPTFQAMSVLPALDGCHTSPPQTDCLHHLLLVLRGWGLECTMIYCVLSYYLIECYLIGILSWLLKIYAYFTPPQSISSLLGMEGSNRHPAYFLEALYRQSINWKRKHVSINYF